MQDKITITPLEKRMLESPKWRHMGWGIKRLLSIRKKKSEINARRLKLIFQDD